MNLRVCDVCGNKNKEAQQRWFWKDRKMDESGSMADEHEIADLCVLCELQLYQKVLGKAIANTKNRERLLAETLHNTIQKQLSLKHITYS